MPAGYMRIPADGPYCGNPPVISGPNIASIIAHDRGGAANTEFSPAATVGVTWLLGGLFVPLAYNTRIGARYLIDAQFSLTAPSSTLCHLYTPRWNRRIASTGNWLTADATAPIFNPSATMSSPNNSGITTVAEINTVGFRTLWTADAECDAVQLAMTCLTGVVGGQFLRNPECILTVWELGGLVP